MAWLVTYILLSQVHSCACPICSDLLPVIHQPCCSHRPPGTQAHDCGWISDFRLMLRDQRAMTCPRSHV